LTWILVLPHDAYGRNIGLFIGTKLPFILGTNLAGVVQSLGPSPSPSIFVTAANYKVGDHIFGQAAFLDSPIPDQPGLQQYAILDIAATAPTPPDFTDDQVVSLPVNAVTSFIALFHPTSGFGFPPPSLQFLPTPTKTQTTPPPLARPSSSAPAPLSVAWPLYASRLTPLRTIIAIASPSHTPELKKLGTTHVLDRHLLLPELVSEAHAISNGDPESITHIYDCANWTFELAVALLAQKSPVNY